MTDTIKRRFAAWIKRRQHAACRTIATSALAAATVLAAGTAPSLATSGDRTLTLFNAHTKQAIRVTYMRGGRIDESAAQKLDVFLGDWRKKQSIRMDRELYDVLWQVQQSLGPSVPITIICGYRSPSTNAMLRGRSKRSGVAEHSQHTLGRAIDFFMPGVPIAKVREIGFRISAGGVGFYPTSGSPFVHLDVGSVRAWPKPSRQLLAKIFPDGKTAYLSSSGPMPKYAEAVAELKQRGPSPIMLAAAVNAAGTAEGAQPSLFAKLFGPRRPSTPSRPAPTPEEVIQVAAAAPVPSAAPRTPSHAAAEVLAQSRATPPLPPVAPAMKPAETLVAAMVPVPQAAPRQIDVAKAVPVQATAVPMPRQRPADDGNPAGGVQTVALAYASPSGALAFEDIVGISPIARINSTWDEIAKPESKATPSVLTALRCGLTAVANRARAAIGASQTVASDCPVERSYF